MDYVGRDPLLIFYKSKGVSLSSLLSPLSSILSQFDGRRSKQINIVSPPLGRSEGRRVLWRE
jgi:hypothetical protein